MEELGSKVVTLTLEVHLEAIFLWNADFTDFMMINVVFMMLQNKILYFHIFAHYARFAHRRRRYSYFCSLC